MQSQSDSGDARQALAWLATWWPLPQETARPNGGPSRRRCSFKPSQPPASSGLALQFMKKNGKASVMRSCTGEVGQKKHISLPSPLLWRLSAAQRQGVELVPTCVTLRNKEQAASKQQLLLRCRIGPTGSHGALALQVPVSARMHMRPLLHVGLRPDLTVELGLGPQPAEPAAAAVRDEAGMGTVETELARGAAADQAAADDAEASAVARVEAAEDEEGTADFEAADTIHAREDSGSSKRRRRWQHENGSYGDGSGDGGGASDEAVWTRQGGNSGKRRRSPSAEAHAADGCFTSSDVAAWRQQQQQQQQQPGCAPSADSRQQLGVLQTEAAGLPLCWPQPPGSRAAVAAAGSSSCSSHGGGVLDNHTTAGITGMQLGGTARCEDRCFPPEPELEHSGGRASTSPDSPADSSDSCQLCQRKVPSSLVGSAAAAAAGAHHPLQQQLDRAQQRRLASLLPHLRLGVAVSRELMRAAPASSDNGRDSAAGDAVRCLRSCLALTSFTC